MEIKWIPVKDYPNYEVSNFGDIRNKKNHILKPAKDRDGYLKVILSKNNNRKCFQLHRIVAEAFLADWNAELTVDHIDYNRSNNHIDNLRMLTKSENSSRPRLPYKKRNVKINHFDKDMNLITTYKNPSEFAKYIIKMCELNPCMFNGNVWKFDETL